MCKISVIIPVYNCAPFLSRCLESIINQTYRNWEAICINDGSKDNSGEILDTYALKDERIKVIHKQNEGVSKARNTALEHMTGEYAIFVDSDDFLHPQLMDICIYFAQKDKSDMVAFTYNRKYRTLQTIGHLLHIPEPKRIKFKSYVKEEIPSLVTDNIYDWATEYSHSKGNQDKKWMVKHCQPWRCLYRSEKIRHIRFIPGIIYEDFPWWGEVLLNTERATIINLPLYHYYPNKGSYILSSKQQYRIESLKIAIDAAEQIYKDINDSRKEVWNLKFIVPFKQKLEKKIARYGDYKA